MLPRSLYIHIPWCIRKCPYCDFNSHKSPEQIPEQLYINRLIEDFVQDIQKFPIKQLNSIFIGGGTPSLLSAESYENLFNNISKYVHLPKNLEITLEANPGTVDLKRFADYRKLGINRLSLGVQSFNPSHLKILGRIHDEQQAKLAIKTARDVGFDNINIDIMYSLPKQSVKEGIEDLKSAISYTPEHLSWYQLTIEPNTVFYKQRPSLPNEDDTYELEKLGLNLLKENGYGRYEISAYSQINKQSQHNLNYWLFGDYYGIGAGAHGKITHENKIYRTNKHRQPSDYLNPSKQICNLIETTPNDAIIEFIINTTRLEQAIDNELFTNRTGIDFNILLPKLKLAAKKGLIQINTSSWQVTELGRQYTNDLQEMFI